MDWTKRRIGYWPNKVDLNSPGDRRRYIFYAKELDIPVHIASTKEIYDIVYLTMGCNITQWLDYKKAHPEVKMVFEIVDSYFLEDLNFFTAVRGLVRYLIGRESKLYINYRRAIKKMLITADAVVCSTPIQKEYFRPYNRNVHISLDYFSNDITHYKTDYSINGKLKLVWEGQSYTANNILHINEILEELKDEVELHIITDPEIKYPFKIFNKNTAKVLSSIPCDYYIHKWEKHTFSKIIAEMDLAIIPLGNDKHIVLTMNKPENKLLLFWQIGIPAITSTSPAYERVMDKAGLDLYCIDSKEEWISKIRNFIHASVQERKQLTCKASRYLENFHSREIVVQKWNDIFESLYK